MRKEFEGFDEVGTGVPVAAAPTPLVTGPHTRGKERHGGSITRSENRRAVRTGCNSNLRRSVNDDRSQIGERIIQH